MDRERANSELRLGATLGVIAALAFGLAFYAAVMYIS